jgi:hypothetical protein
MATRVLSSRPPALAGAAVWGPCPNLRMTMLALVLLLGLAFAPREASAQTVAQTMGATLLDYTNPMNPSTHPNNVDATWISYADCENDVYIQVPLTLTPPSGGSFSGYILEAWATANTSADCGSPTYNNATTGVCWQVLPSDIAPSLSVTPNIYVRDLLANLGSTAGSGINPAYPNATGTDKACHTVTTSGAIPISLQFIWFQNGSSNEVNSLQIGLNAELIGPEPPSGVTAGIGETLLVLNWLPVDDPNTKGFSIFVDPFPGQEGVLEDASAIDSALPTETICADAGFRDGGLDEAGDPIQIPIDGGQCHTAMVKGPESSQENNTCPSTILVSGVTGDAGAQVAIAGDAAATDSTDASFVATNVTGTAPSAQALAHLYTTLGDGTATQYTLKGLKDGYNYTIAIAAVDNLNDNGPLSVPACAIPSPIDDFWTIYRDSGGLAGGGFCALEGVGVPTGAGIFGIAMAGALLGSVRRRRRHP